MCHIIVHVTCTLFLMTPGKRLIILLNQMQRLFRQILQCNINMVPVNMLFDNID